MADRQYAREFFSRADLGACPVCNLTYVEDYPPDQLTHARCHRAVLNTFEPRPNARIAKLYVEYGEFIPVFLISRLYLRRRVFRAGRAFLREFGSDIPPYEERNDTGHSFLISDAAGRSIGAFTVRWQEYSNATARWALAWIWIAPAHRRHGTLARAWEFVRPRFDGIEPEGPFSKGAAAFFATRSDIPGRLREYARRTLEQASK